MLSLPVDLLRKTASLLSLEDLARSFHVGGPWSKIVCERLSPVLKWRTLRAIVFDDGDQPCGVWLQLDGIKDGKAIYRQTTPKPRKKTLLLSSQFPHGHQTPTWIQSTGDMRSEHLHLDLDSHDDYSFGTVVLGKDWDARRKVNRRREIQDDGTFLDYHVEFDEETFMSWFRHFVERDQIAASPAQGRCEQLLAVMNPFSATIVS